MSETTTLFPSTNRPPWALSLGEKINIDSQEIRLISWLGIWTAVSAAKRHGNLQMLDLFLTRLFEEAMLDDEGAWLVPNTASRTKRKSGPHRVGYIDYAA
ncbi:MAG: hypothetical protein ACREQW_08465 [Candidatus Binatia bacterium]